MDNLRAALGGEYKLSVEPDEAEGYVAVITKHHNSNDYRVTLNPLVKTEPLQDPKATASMIKDKIRFMIEGREKKKGKPHDAGAAPKNSGA